MRHKTIVLIFIICLGLGVVLFYQLSKHTMSAEKDSIIEIAKAELQINGNTSSLELMKIEQNPDLPHIWYVDFGMPNNPDSVVWMTVDTQKKIVIQKTSPLHEMLKK